MRHVELPETQDGTRSEDPRRRMDLTDVPAFEDGAAGRIFECVPQLGQKARMLPKLEYIPGVLQRTMFGYDVVFDLIFGYIRPGSWGVRQFRNATASRKDLPVFYPVPSHMVRVVVSVPSTPSS
jgi:hypothetical protein